MNDCLNLAVFLEKKLHSGNCSIEIGKILLERQCWGDAVKALSNGIEKGNLDDSSAAFSLLAKCHTIMGDAAQGFGAATTMN